MELANAYTELNDPITQEQTFRSSSPACRKKSRWPRWTTISSAALRHGMPPAGGLGIGIDRLVHAADEHADDPRRDPVPAAAAGKMDSPQRHKGHKERKQRLNDCSCSPFVIFVSLW